MATTPQSSKTTGTYRSPITTKSAAKAGVPRGNQTFLFDKNNYMWMGIGLLCIIIGFFLLSGGKSPDPHQFNYNEVYSFRRITLAPIVILIGFGIEAYAIMKKHPAKHNEEA
jgi:hypothetical protein